MLPLYKIYIDLFIFSSRRIWHYKCMAHVVFSTENLLFVLALHMYGSLGYLYTRLIFF